MTDIKTLEKQIADLREAVRLLNEIVFNIHEDPFGFGAMFDRDQSTKDRAAIDKLLGKE